MGKVIQALFRAAVFTAIILSFGGFFASSIVKVASFQLCPGDHVATLDPARSSHIHLRSATANVVCTPPLGEWKTVDPSYAFWVIAASYTSLFFLLFLLLPAQPNRKMTPIVVDYSKTMNELPREELAKIQDLLSSGRVMNAIKEVRSFTHMDLKSSKEFTEFMRKNPNIVTSVVSTNTADVGDRLEAVTKLRRDGHISEEEYTQKRKEILESV